VFDIFATCPSQFYEADAVNMFVTSVLQLIARRLMIGKTPRHILASPSYSPRHRNDNSTKNQSSAPPALLAYQEGQANHPMIERQEKWSAGDEI
jgi:hypothetical protein